MNTKKGKAFIRYLKRGEEQKWSALVGKNGRLQYKIEEKKKKTKIYPAIYYIFWYKFRKI